MMRYFNWFQNYLNPLRTGTPEKIQSFSVRIANKRVDAIWYQKIHSGLIRVCLFEDVGLQSNEIYSFTFYFIQHVYQFHSWLHDLDGVVDVSVAQPSEMSCIKNVNDEILCYIICFENTFPFNTFIRDAISLKFNYLF